MGTSEDSRQNGLLPTPLAGNPGSRRNGGGKILAEEVGKLNGLLKRSARFAAGRTPTAQEALEMLDLSELTSLQAAFPASPFRPQGSERERKMTASSGLRCFGLFERSSPVGSLARTLLASLRWHSDKCVLTWKNYTTKSNVSLYQLAPSTRPTEETGCGLLHTVSAQEAGVTVERLVTKEGEPAKIGERAYDKDTGRLAQVGLTQQLQMLLPTPWVSMGNGPSQSEIDAGNPKCRLETEIALLPTPTLGDRRSKNSRQQGVNNVVENLLPTPRTCSAMGASVTSESANDPKRFPNLETVVEKNLLPTPQAIDGSGEGRRPRLKKDCRRDPNQSGSWRADLKDAIALLPTPAAQDWKGSRTPETLEAVGRLPSNDLESSLTGAETGAKLRLSPAFTEWMMGYPKGWLDFPMEAPSAKADGDKTASKPTETP